MNLSKWKYLEGEGTDAFRHLATEQTLLRQRTQALFLWTNSPTVVVGQNQFAQEECDAALCRTRGIRICRRSTGGGAVYHDEGTLNLSWIAPNESSATEQVFACIRRTLERLGIRGFCREGNDGYLSGRKILGEAHRQSGGYTLSHCCILVQTNLAVLEAVLTPSSEKLQRHGVQSVRARVANVCEFQPVTQPVFAEALKEELLRSFDCEVQKEPSPEETLLRELQAEEYIFQRPEGQ